MGRIPKHAENYAGTTGAVEVPPVVEQCVPMEDSIDFDVRRLDDLFVAALIRFFETLDRWDGEAKGNAKSM